MLIAAPDSPLATRLVPSPNHGERAAGRSIDAIVLHYTGMASGPAAIAWLADPRSQVSAHYVVEEDGAILQMVPEERRAWHAGRGSWRGESDLNSVSIGIEIVNGGHDYGCPDYPDAQIEAVIALCADIAARRRVPPDRVLAHSDIAPERKADPGEKFPWSRLATHGLGLFAPARPLGPAEGLAAGAAGPAVAALQAKLSRVGYAVGEPGLYDAATQAAVVAFQRRHRPERIDGVADASTVGTLEDVIMVLDEL
jgi:N-acetylmuramoyl-L-alanine amidase